MARLVGKAVVGAPGDVHTTAQNTVGMECDGENGTVYKYLPGVASNAIGTWNTYDENYVTIRAIANAQGNVAVATAGAVATEYEWMQIVGEAQALALTAFADNGKVYLTGTAGSVDDTDVAGDFVVGAIGRSAVDETTFLATFQLDRPKVQDTTFD